MSSVGSVSRRAGWCTTLPAVAVTALGFAAPMAVMLAYSFAARSGGRLTGWTFENYANFWTRPFLLGALRNSMEVTLTVTVLSTLVAYPLAYVLAFVVPARWRRPALILIVLPFWTSYLVRSYAWLLVLSPGGVVSEILQNLGLVSAPVGFANSRTATVIGFVHYFVMLSTLTIYANLTQIIPSYRRAAEDLGASAWSSFVHVTLPLSLPGVLVGAFLTFVSVIGDYVTPQVLGGSREMLLPQATMLIIGRDANFPGAAAIGIVIMLMIGCVYAAFANRLRMDRV